MGCEDSGGADEPVVLHCLYGEPAHTFLGAMSRFLAANPREFLILDFQHLYKFSCQDHAAILHRVQTLFGSRICPCPARQANIAVARRSSAEINRDIIHDPFLFSVAQGIFSLSIERLSRSTLHLKEGERKPCNRVVLHRPLCEDSDKIPESRTLHIFSISLV